MIFDQLNPPESNDPIIIDPEDATRFYQVPKDCQYEDLLKPIFEKGILVYEQPTIEVIRKNAMSMYDKLHMSIRRLLNPHHYPAGLEKKLHKFKVDLIYKMKLKKENI